MKNRTTGTGGPLASQKMCKHGINRSSLLLEDLVSVSKRLWQGILHGGPFLKLSLDYSRILAADEISQLVMFDALKSFWNCRLSELFRN